MGRERALPQLDPVDRIGRLDGELRRERQTPLGDGEPGVGAAVERAVLDERAAGHPPLLAEREAGAHGAEVVAADRQHDAAGDGKRLGQILVDARVDEAEPIAVLELDAELGVGLARLRPAGHVLEVVDRPAP